MGRVIKTRVGLDGVVGLLSLDTGERKPEVVT